MIWISGRIGCLCVIHSCHVVQLLSFLYLFVSLPLHYSVRNFPVFLVCRCPSKDTVACFADPCSVSSCPANPSAICLASYCKNTTYNDQPVGPCEAVYVDEYGNRVDCKASNTDIT